MACRQCNRTLKPLRWSGRTLSRHEEVRARVSARDAVHVRCSPRRSSPRPISTGAARRSTTCCTSSGSTRCARRRSSPRSSATALQRSGQRRLGDGRRRRPRRDARSSCKRFEAIDTTGFPEQEKLNRDLMVRDLRDGIEGAKFKDWQMPVNQMSGIHLGAAQLPVAAAVRDRQGLRRLRRPPRQVPEDLRRHHRQHAQGHGRRPDAAEVPAREGRRRRREGIADDASRRQSPFAAAAAELPRELSGAEQERIRAAVLAAIRNVT